MSRLRPMFALCAVLAGLCASPAAATAATTAAGCDPITPDGCVLPFPNNRFTRPDAGTPTGRRVALRLDAMPRTKEGTPIGVRDLNRADGFSPGAMLIAHVPGLDAAAMTRSAVAPIVHPAWALRRSAPVLVLDEKTGRRWPVVAELDAQADTPEHADLLIRPLRNFREGHTYVVVLRNLVHGDGSRIGPATPAFGRIARGAPRGPSERTRARQLRGALGVLRRAGVPARSMTLAWDFTVSSAKSLSGPLLSIRDRTFRALGDRNLADGRIAGAAPRWTITKVTDHTAAQDPNIIREVRGEVTVPCWLDQPGCPTGSRFTVGRDGLPVRTAGNTTQAPFVCEIPRSLVTDTGVRPGLPALYGHGLLGSREEIAHGEKYQEGGNENGVIFCGVDWIGMASEDAATIATKVLPDLTNFPMMADRLQQGILNFMVVGRALAHPQGLRTDPAFRFTTPGGSGTVIGDGLGFNGNSQGGIIGGALTAVAPDFTHAVLGVPAMAYATLLDRSSDFPPFAGILYTHYDRGVQRPLLMDLIQQLWDRGEGDGYAQHMTTDPLPNTPLHDVLLLEAFGDHQVANFATEVEARTIGARLRTPALDAGRSGPFDAFFAIPAIARMPYRGSALVVMDSGPLRTENGRTVGTPPPPTDNTPPDIGQDPHGLGGTGSEIRRIAALFLKKGIVDQGCGGLPCYIGGYKGS